MGTEVVLRLLIDKLKSLLGGEERARLTTELHDEFSKIISDSEGLIPFVQAADASAETEARRIWMKGVREVVFEVEDILDDLALHLWQHESADVLYKVFSIIPYMMICNRITVQIREIHTKFQKISEGAHVYLMAGGILSSASDDHDHPMFPPHLEEDDIVREESFLIRYGEEGMKFYGRVRRLSINDNFAGGLMLQRSHHLLHLQSLLVFGKERIFGSLLAEMGVHKFRFLKVLDLEGTPVKSLPAEIGNLLHLRYLSLRNTMITSLPKSLGKLVHIETLDLKGTGISALPIEILKLKFLRHLIVGCYGMNGVSVPKGIGKLSALQTLTCINVAGELAAISELGNLMQLMKLCIANLRSEDGRTLCSSIEKMNRLISFKAMSKDDNQSLDLPAISPTPPRLQRIHLNGRLENLPDWIASLHNLVKMSLFGSRLSDDPLKILQSLPNLAVLTLEAAYDGEELCCQAEGLPKLKVLKLARLDGLKSIGVEEGAMPCLQKLHLDECKMLEKVPSGIQHLTSLKELYLMKMPDALIKRIASDGGEDHGIISHIPLVRTESISTPAGE